MTFNPEAWLAEGLANKDKLPKGVVLPDAVDYGWLYHCHEALAILPIVNARLDAVEKERDALRGAISWIEPPFVDGNTSKKEMRQRIAFAVADAERAQTLGGNHEG